MPYKRNDLTNEQLKGRFTSQFELANFAIDIAQKNIAQEQQTSLYEVLDQLTDTPFDKEK